MSEIPQQPRGLAERRAVPVRGRADVPCDREHLDQLRAPSSDIAVPSNPAALESVASLLAHRRAVA
jgi:hypothetical protein